MYHSKSVSQPSCGNIPFECRKPCLKCQGRQTLPLSRVTPSWFRRIHRPPLFRENRPTFFDIDFVIRISSLEQTPMHQRIPISM